MPIDPILEPLLAQLPDTQEIPDLQVFRSQQDAAADGMALQLCEAAPEGAECRTVEIAVDGGVIALNVYTPSTPGPHPAHLYFHGGGWIAGSIKSLVVDITCRERAVDANCVVVSVNYRKAPENPFPTAVEDGYCALVWVVEHARELDIRPDVITIGGGSAGANIAAGLALKARNEGSPAITAQILEVLPADLTLSADSYRRNAVGYGLSSATVRLCVDHYLASAEDAEHAYASPLRAPDLSGLPPAHLLSAEFDPVGDDGQAYADRLVEAGVPAKCTTYPGQIHVSAGLTKLLPAARAWREEVLSALREAHSLATTA